MNKLQRKITRTYRGIPLRTRVSFSTYVFVFVLMGVIAWYITR